jgi:hypothetical protein
MAGNTHTIQDPLDGNKYDDWFELYNYGTNTVNLAGYYLTDALTNQFQFLIPPGYTIPPHGFLLVWADKKTPTGSGDLHVNFKLSKSGEAIGLYGSDSNPVDYVVYGVQTDDVSEGRYPDGAGGLRFMTTATPRTNNIAPNTAPTLAAISNQILSLGQTLAFYASAADTDQPPQTLTFTLGPGAPGNASLNAASGLFTWTPTNAPATNAFAVIVTDNGVPNLSATQTFLVTVTRPAQPSLGSPSFTNGQFRLLVSGDAGPNYTVQGSTNLFNWEGLLTTNPSSLPFLFTDPAATNYRQRFYRVLLGP